MFLISHVGYFITSTADDGLSYGIKHYASFPPQRMRARILIFFAVAVEYHATQWIKEQGIGLAGALDR
jgi:hypothetical protein